MVDGITKMKYIKNILLGLIVIMMIALSTSAAQAYSPTQLSTFNKAFGVYGRTAYLSPMNKGMGYYQGPVSIFGNNAQYRNTYAPYGVGYNGFNGNYYSGSYNRIDYLDRVYARGVNKGFVEGIDEGYQDGLRAGENGDFYNPYFVPGQVNRGYYGGGFGSGYYGSYQTGAFQDKYNSARVSDVLASRGYLY